MDIYLYINIYVHMYTHVHFSQCNLFDPTTIKRLQKRCIFSFCHDICTIYISVCYDIWETLRYSLITYPYTSTCDFLNVALHRNVCLATGRAACTSRAGRLQRAWSDKTVKDTRLIACKVAAEASWGLLRDRPMLLRRLSRSICETDIGRT